MRRPAAVICAVAAMPSCTGIRMSMTTTSGQQAPGLPDRVGAVPGLADDLHVRFGVENHPEPGAHQGLIVGEQDPDHASSRGMAAWTRNPPPAFGPTVSRPPRAVTRSRIPTVPRPAPGTAPDR